MRKLLGDAGFESDVESRRGLDHGVFVPFLLIYPNADVPILQLSLQASLDPDPASCPGQRLGAVARSGRSDRRQRHELSQFGRHVFRPRRARRRPPSMPGWGRPCKIPRRAIRLLAKWRDAPGGAASHPREEHLIPLMVAAGAAQGDRGIRSFGESIGGKQISGFQFG